MVKEKIKREIRKYFELNEKENTIYQNSWNAANTVLIGLFLALNTIKEKKKEN